MGATFNDDGRAHAVAVTTAVGGAALGVGDLGRRLVANTGAGPGIAAVFGLHDETLVVRRPTAVIHRAAPDAGELAGSRGADCLPVELGTG